MLYPISNRSRLKITEAKKLIAAKGRVVEAVNPPIGGGRQESRDN
jgi:hypothetical protein